MSESILAGFDRGVARHDAKARKDSLSEIGGLLADDNFDAAEDVAFRSGDLQTGQAIRTAGQTDDNIKMKAEEVLMNQTGRMADKILEMQQKDPEGFAELAEPLSQALGKQFNRSAVEMLELISDPEKLMSARMIMRAHEKELQKRQIAQLPGGGIAVVTAGQSEEDDSINVLREGQVSPDELSRAATARAKLEAAGSDFSDITPSLLHEPLSIHPFETVDETTGFAALGRGLQSLPLVSFLIAGTGHEREAKIVLDGISNKIAIATDPRFAAGGRMTNETLKLTEPLRPVDGVFRSEADAIATFQGIERLLIGLDRETRATARAIARFDPTGNRMAKEQVKVDAVHNALRQVRAVLASRDAEVDNRKSDRAEAQEILDARKAGDGSLPRAPGRKQGVDNSSGVIERAFNVPKEALEILLDNPSDKNKAFFMEKFRIQSPAEVEMFERWIEQNAGK